MTEPAPYDRLTELTAEYQRALRGRDKWEARVEAAKREIDKLVSSSTTDTPATEPVPTPEPAPAPEPTPVPEPAPVA